tara:strand:+ start:599 stop:775 length:177 start_codon:yes stop_codon:yes gene_type:complete
MNNKEIKLSLYIIKRTFKNQKIVAEYGNCDLKQQQCSYENTQVFYHCVKNTLDLRLNA